MIIPNNTLRRVGYFDEENFGAYGWGADFSYSMSVRKAGKSVMVTRRAYLNHIHQGTARYIENYEGLAGAEMNTGMTKVWGPDWQKKLWGEIPL